MKVPDVISKKMEERIKALLERGVKEGVYPGAVLMVGLRGKVILFQEIGNRALVPHSLPMERDTIFDLASLTKPLGTTLALMKLVDMRKIELDQSLHDLLPEVPPVDKLIITPRHLLSHSSGFPDWLPLFLELEEVRQEERKEQLRQRLLGIDLVYPVGKGVIYSDLGFMLLEWVIEEAAGKAMPLFLQKSFYAPLSLDTAFFSNHSKRLRQDAERFAATERCPWRRQVLQGSVHDENAFALGGWSGHAGLFGTAGEVFTLVEFLRAHFAGERSDYFKPETIRGFFTRQDLVNGSTWALGWDTPSKHGSSSGRYFSETSVGHLGFTGTSIWMDLNKDLVIIFLTNRVHPTRKNEKIKAFRPILHDLIMEVTG